MPILSLEKVCKSFGALAVAQEVSFSLEAGEALGIIGPNGAGKSTLFNLITGNIAVDSGRIAFDGADITHAPPMTRCLAGLGRTFQIPQPFETLSVFENLLVAGAFGTARSEAQVAERCAEILLETGLLARANDTAGRLSLLERKRLELARALATQPKLLLLDEIAGGLTDAECDELIVAVRAIHASGVAIIWIEHVLHALNSVVGRLLVLDFGKVIGIGAPDAIMASTQVREIYLGIEV
jgi:branched-chain amino acid transport system ATP-binding protein